MDRRTIWLFAAMSGVVVSGCGGTNSPILGTGQSPRIRAQDLISTPTPLTVQYDNSSNPIGTSLTVGQLTAYTQEGEGNNTVSFLNAGSTIASDNMVYQYSKFYTVSIYTKNSQFGTFALADNNIALDNGTSQIRVADANTGQAGNVDVYVTAGSSNSLIAANLISPVNGGLAFATGTAYKSEVPGQYTITVTPTGVPGTILLNQTLSVNGGQSITLYALAGGTFTTTTDDTGS